MKKKPTNHYGWTRGEFILCWVIIVGACLFAWYLAIVSLVHLFLGG